MSKKTMIKVMSLVISLVVITSVFAFSLSALAAPTSGYFNNYGGDNTGANWAGDAGLGSADLVQTVTRLIQIFIGLLGIIAVVIILIGGFKWMTAGGSEDKVAEAKKLITAGIVGLIIILFAYAIAVFVINLIGNASNG